MRDLYAASMQLVHVGGGNAFDIAVRRALKWSFARTGETPPDLRRRPSGSMFFDEDTIPGKVAWSAHLEGSLRVLQVQLQHADSDDASLTWKATTTVSESDGVTRATLRLARGAKVHVLRPWSLTLRAPGLATELMKPPLLGYVGTLELSPGVRTITGDQAADFVHDIIRAPGRALPVVVAAHDVPQQLTRALAKALAGLAQVVRGLDGAADEAVRNSLRPDGLDVPAKGIRLFWPGIGTADTRLRHPFWTRSQIEAGRRRDRPSIVTKLVNLLAPLSTGRVPADPAVLEARKEQLRARAHAIPRQRSKPRPKSQPAGVAETDALRAHVADLTVRLQNAEEEHAAAVGRITEMEARELETIEEALSIQEQNGDLSSRVAELTTELDVHKANLKTFTRYSPDGDADDLEEEQDESPPRPTTWEEVGRLLPTLDSPGFELTSAAVKCASEKFRYPHPAAMWDSLARLARVGHAYNEHQGQLGMRFDQFAARVAGLDVALQDSEYEDACWFEHEGEWLSRLPHVKIDDAKAPNEVGRIYFAIDGKASRLVVDWFGTKPDRPQTRRNSAPAVF